MQVQCVVHIDDTRARRQRLDGGQCRNHLALQQNDIGAPTANQLRQPLCKRANEPSRPKAAVAWRISAEMRPAFLHIDAERGEWFNVLARTKPCRRHNGSAGISRDTQRPLSAPPRIRRALELLRRARFPGTALSLECNSICRAYYTHRKAPYVVLNSFSTTP